MASPSGKSVETLARLLNLNATDTEAYQEVFDAYFGDRQESENDSTTDEEQSSDAVLRANTSKCFSPDDSVCEVLTTELDLSERIVPLERKRPHLSAIPAPPSPDQPNLHIDPPSTSTKGPVPYPCSCKSTPCYSNFDAETIQDIRHQYIALTDKELDIAVLSKISSGIHLDSTTRKSRKAVQTERKASRTDYLLHGHCICRDFFLYIHDIGLGKLTTLIKHYKACGVEARVHKSKKRLPHNTLKYEDTRRVVDFIINYAEIHAIELPGRTPRHWITNVKLLPTHCTKTLVYELYKTSSEEAGNHCVHISTFRKLWRQLVPFIRTMPPATDLCWTCQRGMQQIQLSANKSDEEKRRLIDNLNSHQEIVQNERSFYQHSCEMVKAQLPPARLPGPHPYCSFQGKNHISFDFAQQTHFPSDPLQAGPIYFKTPRKCGLFGINNEALGKQVNILVDEAHNTGKGANTVVSYLHFYLENFSLGETELLLHADNCAGQNKNSVMIWYLMWRCGTARNRNICLSFLIAGHTKFSPDGGFGLIKRKLKVTKVDCLQDLVKVVDASAAMNKAILVGTENGVSQLPTYDWTTFLSKYFSKVKGIKTLQHFSFDNSGVITVKKHSNAPETAQALQKAALPGPGVLPPVIPSPGLSLKRQQYLFKEIRQFVSPHCQDVVTPEPTAVPEDSGSDSSDSEYEMPAKVTKTVAGPGKAIRGRGRGRGRRAKTE
ncbi:uncharacterized protein LOC118477573 [Aplysia californica]|uniref:Uncharacterized protein LOC118477573 n=1 Tax=Aplysia californica TaxID=6500 RepID=A0ABM1VS87_APLCA|nr:uncharacterized protein LOC118477573 [Aplysia californica]